MRIFRKKTIVIPSEEVVEVEAADIWRVEWWSMERRRGTWSGYPRPEIEVFTSEHAAREFADRLKDAITLLKDHGETRITVRQDGYKGIANEKD